MSFEFSISDRDKASAEFMSKVHRVLMRELRIAAKKRKLTKSDIARLLEVERSTITRALDGKSNLTIRTVSDLCWAVGVEPAFDACEAASAEGCNHLPKRKKQTFVSSAAPMVQEEKTNSKRATIANATDGTKLMSVDYGT